MRGRKPIPTTLHILKGNPSKKKDLGKNEPKPAPATPRCPSWLHPDAKAEWKRIVPQLRDLGLLSQVDMAALVGYCQSWAWYKQANEYLLEHGDVYDLLDDHGNVKYSQQRPQVGIANKQLANIKAFCVEFGMTPSSRARMSVPGASEEDEMERLLTRGG